MMEIRPSDVIVDNTILSSFICSTRGAMHHVLGLKTTQEAATLRSGQAVHEGLAWWLCTGGDVEAALDRYDEVYREWSKANLPADDRLAWAPIRSILAYWFKKNPYDKWKFVVKAEEVEVPLVATLGFADGTRVRTLPHEKDNPRVVMVALLDAIGKMRTGGRWSIDHKTTGKHYEAFEKEQEDSSQFTGQMWLAKQNGMVLSGVYINRIHTKEVPGSNKRCSTHATTYAECGQQHLDHRLFPVTRTPHEIDAWERTARGLASKYLRLRERVKTVEDVRELPMEGRFARECTYCDFRDWCSMGRPAGATKSFIKDRWNPLDHAKKLAEAVKGARA